MRRLLTFIVDITGRLDEAVEQGFDLTRWDDQMKFLHALQLQAQALIDLVCRLAAYLGHSPSTPIDAARFLLERGIISYSELEIFRKIVGFRNVIVHCYLTVDMSLVESILRERKYRTVLELAEKICNRSRLCFEDP